MSSEVEPIHADRLEELRRLAQENLGCVGAVPVYPSELLSLVLEYRPPRNAWLAAAEWLRGDS